MYFFVQSVFFVLAGRLFIHAPVIYSIRKENVITIDHSAIDCQMAVVVIYCTVFICYIVFVYFIVFIDYIAFICCIAFINWFASTLFYCPSLLYIIHLLYCFTFTVSFSFHECEGYFQLHNSRLFSCSHDKQQTTLAPFKLFNIPPLDFVMLQ